MTNKKYFLFLQLLTLLLILVSRPSISLTREEEFSKFLNILDLDSFLHFDTTFYWSSYSSSFQVPRKFIGSLQFEKIIKTSNSTFDIISTNSVSSTGGFSVVFASLSSFPELEEILNQIANFYNNNNIISSKTFWSPYFFLFLNSSQLTNHFEDDLKKIAATFDLAAKVYIVVLTEQSVIKSVYEIYEIKNVTVLQAIRIKSNYLLSFWDFQHNQRRSNFHGAEIIGVDVDNLNYPLETKYKHDNKNSSDQKIEFESGFNVFEFWYLRDALNFSEVASTWPTYLKQGPNGTLTGLSVPINNGLADIRVGSTEFLEYRFSGPDGITYLHPTFYNEILVFFKQPSASSIRDIFFLTFSTEVWAVLMGTWCLIVTSLVTAVHLKRRTDRHSVHSLDAQLSRDVIVWSVSTICQQGWHISPISTSIRIIFLVGVLTALLSYTAYSAALVSILSVEVIPVRSFQDLLEYKFNIFSDNYIPTSKAVVSNLEDRGIIPKLPNDGRSVDVGESIPLLIKSNMAIVSISDSFYQVLDSRGYDAEFTCSKLSKVPFSSRPVISSFFVKRASPLRDYFNIKILLMKERGVMSILRDHYVRDTSVQCLHESSGFRQQLGGKDLFTAFVVLGSGMSLALFIGFIERIIFLKLH